MGAEAHERGPDAVARLHAALDARAPAFLDLLAALVRIPSHATQIEGVNRVAAVVGAELEACGFVVERPAVDEPEVADAWLSELMLPGAADSPIAPALLARKRHDGVGRVLLLGDLDTAYDRSAFAAFPFCVEGGRALGPGVADMKGGLVLLVAALRALEDTSLLMPSLTTVLLSPDEQAGSLKSRGLIEREGMETDWCLCVECARNGGSLMGSRAHIGVARLDVFGREAHAGSNHAAGLNAIDALARKIPRINGLTDPELGVYVTVGQVGGGRRRSVVPGHAFCTIDVRTPSSDVWRATESALQELAAHEEVPGTRSELRIHAHRPGVPWTSATDGLIEVAREAGRAANVPFDIVRSPAAGSSAFVGSLGVPTLDGMGPVGGDLMTDHEYIDIGSVVERALLLATTLHLLARREAVSLP